MSGHSKWATIKRSKAATDAKRGKLFTRVTREIIAASKASGGDPETNARLRSAITSAKAVNMPSDNIKKAIMKGTGELAGEAIEEITYEGYGPGGVAIMVETSTDNKNRTASDIRSLFAKYNGNMGEQGSVAWMFDKRGVITLKKSGITEESLMDLALEAGAEDIQTDDPDFFTVLTPPNIMEAVANAIKTKVDPESTEITMVPKNFIAVSGKIAESLLKLLDALDDQDDVQKVHANFDMEADNGPSTGA
jgi:YebC/PmpR family DNA-binding regulatory protein